METRLGTSIFSLDSNYPLEFWIDPIRDFRIYKITTANHRKIKSFLGGHLLPVDF